MPRSYQISPPSSAGMDHNPMQTMAFDPTSIIKSSGQYEPDAVLGQELSIQGIIDQFLNDLQVVTGIDLTAFTAEVNDFLTGDWTALLTALFGSSAEPTDSSQVLQSAIAGLTDLWDWLFDTTSPIPGTSTLSQEVITGLTDLWDWLFGTTTPTTPTIDVSKISGVVEKIPTGAAGHGALSGVVKSKKFVLTAAASGRGVFTGAVNFVKESPLPEAEPDIFGHGLLTAIAHATEYILAASLPGRGVLTARVPEVSTVSFLLGVREYENVGLVGQGVLAATVVVKDFRLPAALAGRGTLTGRIPEFITTSFILGYTVPSEQVDTVYPDLFGQGVLTAAATVKKFTLPAVLAGRGVLTGRVPEFTSTSFVLGVEHVLDSIFLFGQGALKATAVAKQFRVAGAAAGQGVLHGKVPDYTTINFVLGVLPAGYTPSIGIDVFGRGVLTASARAANPAGRLTGHGVLTAQVPEYVTASFVIGTTQVVAETDILFGHGALTAAARATNPAGRLAGRGVLTAIVPEFVTVSFVLGIKEILGIELQGQGALRASAVVKRFNLPGALAGRGVLRARVPDVTTVSFVFGTEEIFTVNLTGHGALSGSAAAKQFRVTGGAQGNGSLHGKVPDYTTYSFISGGIPGLTTIDSVGVDVFGRGVLTATAPVKQFTLPGVLPGRGVLRARVPDYTTSSFVLGIKVVQTVEDLAGQGVLSATAVAKKFTLLAALTGQGVLAPRIPETLSFFPAVFPGFIDSIGIELFGKGVLSATAPVKQFKLPAALAGHGSLTALVPEFVTTSFVLGVEQVAINDNLFGNGVLKATAIAKKFFLTGSACDTAGQGVLTAVVPEFVTASFVLGVRAATYPELSGQGALSSIARVAQFQLPGQLSGHGQSTALVPEYITASFVLGTRVALTVDLFGQGVLKAAAVAKKFTVPAVLTGHGVLAPQTPETLIVVQPGTSEIYTLYPQLTGHGVLSAAAVSYDNSAISTRQVSLASGTPFTWSSGGGTAGAYGIVLVDQASEVSGAMTTAATAAVTWGGTPMTSLGAIANDNAAVGFSWVFGLNGIPGGAQTISVTMTQAGDAFTGYGSSYSYNNVASVGALQTAFGTTGSNPAVAVTAVSPNDMVWGAINSNNVSLTVFSLTQRQHSASGAPAFYAGDTTGSAGVAGSGSGTTVWSAVGLDLNGTPAATQFTLTGTQCNATGHGQLTAKVPDYVTTSFVFGVKEYLTPALSGQGVLKATAVSKKFTLTGHPTGQGVLVGAVPATGIFAFDTFTETFTVYPQLTGRGVLGSGGGAIGYDNIGAGGFGGAIFTQSWLETVGATASALVVDVCTDSNVVMTAGVTVGGIAMTLLASVLYENVGGTAVVQVYKFGLLSTAVQPLPIGSQTFVVTTSGTGATGSFQRLNANSASYDNVDGFGTPVTNSGVGTALSLSVPSAPGQVISQVFGGFTTALSAYNQTQRYYKGFVAGVNLSMLMGDAAGATTVNFTATNATSVNWGAIAVPMLSGAAVANEFTLTGLQCDTAGRGQLTAVVPDYVTTSFVLGVKEYLTPALFGQGVLKATAVSKKFTLAGSATGRGVLVGAVPATGIFAFDTFTETFTVYPQLTGHGVLSATTVTYDNSVLSTLQSALASGTPFTWSHTAAGGAYGIVLVYCAANNGPALVGTTMAVTWGGVAMTSLGSQANDNVSGDGWLWAFGLANAPSGAQTLSVTVTHAAQTFTGWGSSYTYNNVASVGSLRTAFGTGGPPSLTVPAVNTTDVVWGATGGAFTSVTAFSLTPRQSTVSPRAFIAGDTTGSNNVTISGATNNNVWAAVGLDLVAGPAATEFTLTGSQCDATGHGQLTAVVPDYVTTSFLLGVKEYLTPTLFGQGVLKATAVSKKFTLTGAQSATAGHGALTAVVPLTGYIAANIPIDSVGIIVYGKGLLSAAAKVGRFTLTGSQCDTAGQGQLSATVPEYITSSFVLGIKVTIQLTLFGNGRLTATTAIKKFTLTGAQCDTAGQGVLSAVVPDITTTSFVNGQKFGISSFTAGHGVLTATARSTKAVVAVALPGHGALTSRSGGPSIGQLEQALMNALWLALTGGGSGTVAELQAAFNDLMALLGWSSSTNLGTGSPVAPAISAVPILGTLAPATSSTVANDIFGGSTFWSSLMSLLFPTAGGSVGTAVTPAAVTNVLGGASLGADLTSLATSLFGSATVNAITTVEADITNFITNAISGGSAPTSSGSQVAALGAALSAIPHTNVVIPPSPGSGTVTHDANGSATAFTSSGVTSETLNWSHTCGSSSNYLIVQVFYYATAASWINSVTYNGTSMALLIDVFGNDLMTNSAIYGLANPPTGSALGVSVNILAPFGQVTIAAAESDSYIGVMGIGATNTAVGTNSSPSLTIASTSNNMLVQTFGLASPTVTTETLTSYNKTSRYNSGNLNVSGTSGVQVAGDAAGAASVTFSATAFNATSDYWTAAAANLIALPSSILGSGFRACNTSTSSISSTTGNQVFPNSFFNSTTSITADGTYSAASSNTFTVTYAGWYTVTIAVLIVSGYVSQTVGLNLIQNGGSPKRGNTSYIGMSTTTTVCAHTFQVYCSAGDTLVPGYYVSFGAPTFTGTIDGLSTYFEVSLNNRSLM